MNTARRWTLVGLVAAALSSHLAGVGLASSDDPSVLEDAGGDPAEAGASSEEVAAWSFSAAVAIYIVPDTRVYAQPTLTADYEWLHLEGRYNYESLDTASLWVGGNLGFGERFTLDFTPMVGGVFGDVTGVAPGFELALAWWKLDFYTEAEYLFDTEDSSGNFAYAWSELAISPWEWLRLGLVGQRTNAYETDVEFQRGLLAGVAWRWLTLTAYVFDLDQDHQPVVLSLEATF
jgi:hypothetical protein